MRLRPQARFLPETVTWGGTSADISAKPPIMAPSPTLVNWCKPAPPPTKTSDPRLTCPPSTRHWPKSSGRPLDNHELRGNIPLESSPDRRQSVHSRTSIYARSLPPPTQFHLRWLYRKEYSGQRTNAGDLLPQPRNGRLERLCPSKRTF